MMGGVTTSWMWIWPALLLVGLLIIGYVVVRLAKGGPGGTGGQVTGPTDPRESARRILDDRYARGEIDDDDYRHRRDRLS